MEPLRQLNNKPPFFVVGCQKSGTTWVQNLMDGHPKACCRGDTNVVGILLPRMFQALLAYNNVQRKQKKSFEDVLLSSVRILETSKFVFSSIIRDWIRWKQSCR